MAFDFKKAYKEYYMPKNKPEVINIPKVNYVAVNGMQLIEVTYAGTNEDAPY